LYITPADAEGYQYIHVFKLLPSRLVGLYPSKDLFGPIIFESTSSNAGIGEVSMKSSSSASSFSSPNGPVSISSGSVGGSLIAVTEVGYSTDDMMFLQCLRDQFSANLDGVHDEVKWLFMELIRNLLVIFISFGLFVEFLVKFNTLSLGSGDILLHASHHALEIIGSLIAIGGGSSLSTILEGVFHCFRWRKKKEIRLSNMTSEIMSQWTFHVGGRRVMCRQVIWLLVLSRSLALSLSLSLSL
jgi:hypothetical protein